MAAVTVNSRYQNVIGSRRQLLLNITIANTGDTLNTGLEAVQMVNCQPATNTPTVVALTGGGTTPVTATFTTGGAYTGNIEVIGT